MKNKPSTNKEEDPFLKKQKEKERKKPASSSFNKQQVPKIRRPSPRGK